MSLSEFPYRSIPDPEVAAELQEQATAIRQELTEVIHAVVAIGRMLSWAQDHVRPEIVHAWLFTEFGWKPRIGAAYVDAAINYESRVAAFNPLAAIEFANQLAAKSLCAHEVAKARQLVAAYRQVLRGDVTFPCWPYIQRCRSSVKGPRRIRSRVYRRGLRREESNPQPKDLD